MRISSARKGNVLPAEGPFSTINSACESMGRRGFSLSEGCQLFYDECGSGVGTKIRFMRTNPLIRILVLSAAISFQASAQTIGPQPEADNIRRLIAEYAKAVDTADLAIVKRIWSNSPDVSFIHPLGHERGFDQVSRNVFRTLMGETFSERKLNIKDVSIHIYGDTAWAEFYWDFAAKFRKDGSPLTTKGRETQIYRKEQGQWRLVHVHYSGMPVTGEPG